MAGKAKVEAQLLGADGTPQTLPKNITGCHKGNGYYQGQHPLFKQVATQKEDDPFDNPGNVHNTHDHPVTLAYNGEAMQLAPRATVTVANIDKLGAVPRGVYVFPKPEHKDMHLKAYDKVWPRNKKAKEPEPKADAKAAPAPEAKAAAPAAAPGGNATKKA